MSSENPIRTDPDDPAFFLVDLRPLARAGRKPDARLNDPAGRTRARLLADLLRSDGFAVSPDGSNGLRVAARRRAAGADDALIALRTAQAFEPHLRPPSEEEEPVSP